LPRHIYDVPFSSYRNGESIVRRKRSEHVLLFRGDLALVAFAVAALFLIAFVKMLKRKPRRRGTVWSLGVAVAAWLGYGVWELYLVGGDYLRLDVLYLWPLLLLVSVFAVVWARREACDSEEEKGRKKREEEKGTS
jgi:hypothetical protein